MVRGETQYNKMSRFLKEIPMDLLSTGMKFDKEEKEETSRQSSWQQARQAFHTKAFSSPRPVQQFKVQGGPDRVMMWETGCAM